MKIFTGAYIENEYGVMTISASERLETYRRRVKELENKIQKTKPDAGVIDHLRELIRFYEKEIKVLEEFLSN